MEKCSCNISLGNTGKANCEPVQELIVKLIFVRRKADDGTLNSIAIDDIVDDNYMQERVNNPDKSKRWYPSRILHGVNMERADPSFESIDGIDYVSEEGLLSFTGFSENTDAVYLSKISSGKCGEFAVFGVDIGNRIIGEISSNNTALYPLNIENGTFWTRLINASQGSVGKTEINFFFNKDLSDCDIRLFQLSGDAIYLDGLLDVNAEIISLDAEQFTTKLVLDYGYANGKQELKWWVESDFNLFDKTTGGVLPVTDFFENINGYNFEVEVAPIDRTVIITEQKPAKNGFDLYRKITIPSIGDIEVLDAYISEDVLFLIFNVAVTVAGVAGMTLNSDGVALTADSFIGGNGTPITAFQLNASPNSEDTVTLDISAINSISSSIGNISMSEAVDIAVDIEAGLTPWVNFDSFLNFDTYVNLD